MLGSYRTTAKTDLFGEKGDNLRHTLKNQPLMELYSYQEPTELVTQLALLAKSIILIQTLELVWRAISI